MFPVLHQCWAWVRWRLVHRSAATCHDLLQYINKGMEQDDCRPVNMSTNKAGFIIVDVLCYMQTLEMFSDEGNLLDLCMMLCSHQTWGNFRVMVLVQVWPQDKAKVTHMEMRSEFFSCLTWVMQRNGVSALTLNAIYLEWAQPDGYTHGEENRIWSQLDCLMSVYKKSLRGLFKFPVDQF